MTELEHSSLMAGSLVVPNTSYDSAIDSLPDEYFSDLASPSSLTLSRSSLAGHMALSASATVASSAASYQSNFSNKMSLSPSLNGPILLNSSNLNPTLHITNAALYYRSLADHHRLNISSLDIEQKRSPSVEHNQASINNQHHQQQSPRDSKTIEVKTSMAMFLDQIDASSSVLTGGGQTRHHDSCSARLVASNSSRRGVTSGVANATSVLSESELPSSATSLINGHIGAPLVHHSGPSEQRVCCLDTPTANTTLSASSPLRSSRSFTASYRHRPNVTLIRRKSASERLAESRSKYIRSDLYANDTLETNIASETNGQIDGSDSYTQNPMHDEYLTPNCTVRQLRATPTSTKSSHTSSSRLSPISDHIPSVTQLEEKCLDGSHPHNNLVDRINCQLNKSKQCIATQHNSSKKRVSPKNSDGSLSNGMSNLEMQLRELITLDTNSEFVPTTNEPLVGEAPTQRHFAGTEPASKQNSDLQKEKESHNIYRAELKFIGSSSSSLSSMYSEPNNLSLLDNNLPNSEMFSVAPSVVRQMKQIFSNVVRSKSDVSTNKQVPNRYRNPYKAHVERLFGSLGLDSDSYHQSEEHIYTDGKNRKSSQSSNLLNYTASSASNDSLQKIVTDKDSVDIACRNIVKKQNNLYGTKSSSTNELSSLNSSQLSVADHIYKNALNHSKSTSKLTFENLMLHQQNLATSRSCHNLVVNLQNGPSVVERNARIIKWLFNCRKAMNQSKPVDTFS